jgi:uncharacterized protein YndB with AHSA1/START domain
LDPVTTSVTIDKPREDVFDYLADLANHPEFMGFLYKDWRLTRIESYGTGAGARFRSTAMLDRFGWGDVNFLTVEYPRRIVAVGRGGKFNRIKTYYEWTLEPAGEGSTRVELMYESEPPLPSDKLIEAVAGRKRWFKRGAKMALRRLRTILEDDRKRGERATVAGL